MLRSTLFRALCALLLAASAPAQNITGTILGTVKDSTGAVVTGAEVSITNMDTNQAVKASTSQIGNYEAPYLRPGRYQVKVAAPGFKTVVRENLELQVENRLRLDFQLEANPDLAGWALIKKLLRAKAPPALAPGVLVQLGLLGSIYGYRHPGGR